MAHFLKQSDDECIFNERDFMLHLRETNINVMNRKEETVLTFGSLENRPYLQQASLYIPTVCSILFAAMLPVTTELAVMSVI